MEFLSVPFSAKSSLPHITGRRAKVIFYLFFSKMHKVNGTIVLYGEKRKHVK